ncbi:hypothetical protein EJ08DRAFT_693809 [Tothia fuscella]|uniref:Uncharacterized protein n=1 Tax=Tothia fuscella TaxID=1048955 RepID=A0A9P4NYU8_9PEZI|nr:hypothetical protein EJ08DRAFT_693809 [Tothia fuscella]
MYPIGDYMKNPTRATLRAYFTGVLKHYQDQLRTIDILKQGYQNEFQDAMGYTNIGEEQNRQVRKRCEQYYYRDIERIKKIIKETGERLTELKEKMREKEREAAEVKAEVKAKAKAEEGGGIGGRREEGGGKLKEREDERCSTIRPKQ